MRGHSEPKELVNREKPDWLRQMEPILETLNDGVLIADESGEILFVNSVFEEMTRMLRSEITWRDGQHMNLRVEDDARLRAPGKKTRKTEPGREAFLLPTKDGQRLPVAVSVRVMWSRCGSMSVTLPLKDLPGIASTAATTAWPSFTTGS